MAARSTNGRGSALPLFLSDSSGTSSFGEFRFNAGNNNAGFENAGNGNGSSSNSNAGNNTAASSLNSNAGNNTASSSNANAGNINATTTPATPAVVAAKSPDTASPTKQRIPRPPKKKAINFGTVIITIHVGTDAHRQTFAVHEAIIRARSTFFTKALSGTWTEAQERVIHLPDDDPAIFSIYNHLIYTGSLPAIQSGDPTSSPTSNDPVKQRLEYKQLCKLYVFGEKVDDAGARNAALSAIYDVASEATVRIPPGAINALYDGTAGHCRARLLLAHIYDYYGDEEWLGATCDNTEFHADFLSVLARVLFRKGRVTASTLSDKSFYLENEAKDGSGELKE